MLGIEGRGDPLDASAFRGESEDSAHDGGLARLDYTLNVAAPRAVEHWAIRVAENEAAGDVAALRLPHKGVVCSQPGAVTLHFRRECRQGQHHPISRGALGRRECYHLA